MKKIFVSIVLAFSLLIYIIPISAYAGEYGDMNLNDSSVELIDRGISYLNSTQLSDGTWYDSQKNLTEEIVNIIEYIDSCESADIFSELILDATEYSYYMNLSNIDFISRYLLIDELYDELLVQYLIEGQNPDGGFGLAENYASDIIDTKIALKALADLGETEAMTKAAIYIASLQNADGGVFDDPMATGCFFSTGVQNLT